MSEQKCESVDNKDNKDKIPEYIEHINRLISSHTDDEMAKKAQKCLKHLKCLKCFDTGRMVRIVSGMVYGVSYDEYVCDVCDKSTFVRRYVKQSDAVDPVTERTIPCHEENKCNQFECVKTLAKIYKNGYEVKDIIDDYEQQIKTIREQCDQEVKHAHEQIIRALNEAKSAKEEVKKLNKNKK